MSPRKTAQMEKEKRLLRSRKRQDAEEVAPPEPSDLDGAEVASSDGSKKRKTDSVQNGVESSGFQLGGKMEKKGKGKAKSLGKSKSTDASKAKSLGIVKSTDVLKGKKGNTVVKADAPKMVDEEIEVEFEEEEEELVEEEEEQINVRRATQCKRAKSGKSEEDAFFVGDSVEESEAKLSWPSRYERNGLVAAVGQEEEEIKAKRHYLKAKIDGIEYDLYDDVYVQADEGMPNYIGRIIELFEGLDKKSYFTAQWFFRAEDTVIRKECSEKLDPKRVFLSDEKNDNPLDCIVSKIKILRVKPNVDEKAKEEKIRNCDYYYDMAYHVLYSTFMNLPPETEEGNKVSENGSDSTISSETVSNQTKNAEFEASSSDQKALSLLDLYAGCGGMSTGLCMGAALSGVKLEAKWAVDYNESACNSLQHNHPNTQVRNEKAEYFLEVMKQWKALCDKFNVYEFDEKMMRELELEEAENEEDDEPLEEGEFIVDRIINICYGDPGQVSGTDELKFLIRWKGYGPEEDTWEPISGLENCQEKLKRFVVEGYRNNILPLPGTVDVLCGGPPCQGISGFNRFRDKLNPLDCEKNSQLLVYMDIVSYLKPKYVLMENVVDILKFSEGFLGRYAVGCLVRMNYQARLGLMVAGSYGLPQFRMRMFLWGALPSEVLPQFPLPTHDVVVRGGAPTEFRHSLVGFDAKRDVSKLKPALVLKDAISELPEVTNSEQRDKMPYGNEPETDFQRFIRLSRREICGFSLDDEEEPRPLYDHMPLNLNNDDFERTLLIPKRKGANFRDLPGLLIGPDNKVSRDPNVEQPVIRTTKKNKIPLVPYYAIKFQKGKSIKPFGRLWWDEIVPTVVGRAEPHNQVILHPSQDRVLTVRENARLQGFPDFYKLYGNTKEKYIQIGNAVAVPVSRALGCALARAFKKEQGIGDLFDLPSNFHNFNFGHNANNQGELDQ
ncbi:hypothetical protein LUZ60_002279 [Juncus effusus]|nr:hypothetical protein LUZ60_002279 [Juncus effusus]